MFPEFRGGIDILLLGGLGSSWSLLLFLLSGSGLGLSWLLGSSLLSWLLGGGSLIVVVCEDGKHSLSCCHVRSNLVLHRDALPFSKDFNNK
jgi:hypothetical protein